MTSRDKVMRDLEAQIEAGRWSMRQAEEEAAARVAKIGRTIERAAFGPTTTEQEDAAWRRIRAGAVADFDALPQVRRDMHRSAQRAERLIAWAAALVLAFVLGALAGRGW